MNNPLKILVSGDVKGNFRALFNRILTIQKRTGDYDMLFCIGEFFGDDDEINNSLLSNQIKIPLSTFILGPNDSKYEKYFADKSGGEICQNLIYLGSSGIYYGSSSLSVAYLSGKERGSLTKLSTNFDANDVENLICRLLATSNFNGVDILLTSQWPDGCGQYALEPPNLEKISSSVVISQLALSIKPRYHFCALEEIAFERQPYRNHKVINQMTQHVTRLITLSSVGNSQKQKYIYAFNIVPMKHMERSELVKQPLDVTECPYKKISLKSLTNQKSEKSDDQFFYDKNVINRDSNVAKRKNFKDGPPIKKSVPLEACWFCLSSPEVEKHLVVSVGEQCYLAMAKGGLTDDHVLIIPISHHQSLSVASQEVLAEIEKYKASLIKMYSSFNKCCIFFERNYKTSHLQLQAVPIPRNLAPFVRDSIQRYASQINIKLDEIPQHTDLSQIALPGITYFYSEISETGERFYCRVKQGFPIQFGREMLIQPSLLNMPEKADWKNCTLSLPDELKIVQKFKESFNKYDFN